MLNRQFLLILGLAGMQNVQAGYWTPGDYGVKASEVRLLPGYCKLIVPENLQPLVRGSLRAPPGFKHGHHFCHGLKFMIRAQQALSDKGLRGYRLKQAIDEFNYVINANEGSSVYLAYTRVNRAKAYEMTGDKMAAVRDLVNAIRLAPKFPLSYARLSDLYLKMEKPDDAREVLRQGLNKAPKSKMLRWRWEKLAGQASNQRGSQPGQTAR